MILHATGEAWICQSSELRGGLSRPIALSMEMWRPVLRVAHECRVEF